MANRSLSLCQSIKDGATGRVGKRPEDKIKILFNHLVECKRFRTYAQPLG